MSDQQGNSCSFEQRVVTIPVEFHGWEQFYWHGGKAWLESAPFVTGAIKYRGIFVAPAPESLQPEARRLFEEHMRVARRRRKKWKSRAAKIRRKIRRQEEARRRKREEVKQLPWAVATKIPEVFTILDHEGFWRRWSKGDGKGVRAIDTTQAKKGRNARGHRKPCVARSFVKMTDVEFDAALDAHVERLNNEIPF